jgi:thymidylate kinase
MVQDHAAPPQPKASIICLEGASAAGKTTLSRAIAERTAAGVIGEVWTLFERPSPEPPLWYLERQVDRWRLAAESAAKHGLAILDGDPFQPLWYGWAYRFAEFQSLSTMTSFYREAITAGHLAFPDLYILLAVAEPVLHERKRGDASRSRRNFAKHVSLLHYQPRYFAAMNAVRPGLAHVLDASAPAATLAEIVISLIGPQHKATDSLALFQQLADWLKMTVPKPANS